MEMEARSFSAERSRALMVKALCPPPLPASLCVLLPPGAATLYIKKASPRMATRTGTRGLEVPLSTPGRLTCAQGSPRAAVRFTRKGRPGASARTGARVQSGRGQAARARARGGRRRLGRRGRARGARPGRRLGGQQCGPARPHAALHRAPGADRRPHQAGAPAAAGDGGASPHTCPAHTDHVPPVLGVGCRVVDSQGRRSSARRALQSAWKTRPASARQEASSSSRPVCSVLSSAANLVSWVSTGELGGGGGSCQRPMDRHYARDCMFSHAAIHRPSVGW